MDGYHTLADGTRLYYRFDDFTDPWKEAPVVVLVHGFAESGEAWRGWVPHLARHYRVLRIDRRGFGRSDPMPVDFPWTLDRMAEDTVSIIEALVPQGAHIVAAKIATPLCIHTAVRRPDLARSLTLVGGPAAGPNGGPWIEYIEAQGVKSWAQMTMDKRLGPEMSAAAKAYWVELMAKSPASTMIGFLRHLSATDVTGELDRIRCPTLVLAAITDYRPVDEVRAWQTRIPNSRLDTIPGDGYHPAAIKPDLCAAKTLAFLHEVDAAAAPAQRSA